MLDIMFEGTVYEVGPEAYAGNLPIQLPDGRFLRYRSWIETSPPQLEGLVLIPPGDPVPTRFATARLQEPSTTQKPATALSDKKAFRTGMTVKLRSGGRSMTVKSIDDGTLSPSVKAGDVWVCWMSDDGIMCSAALNPDMIQEV